MARTKSFLDINSDDDHATRVLALAIKFFGTARALSASAINQEFYPTLDTSSFNRQFLRDRNILHSLGVAIVEVDSPDDETYWQIDQGASFVEEQGISAEDATMLYVLCHDMAFDSSFAYRDELRVALAKISQMYRGTTLGEREVSTPREHKMLSTLVSCMSNRTAVQIVYTDAKGSTSTRTVALLGTFGLREHTYFVASRVERDATLTPDSIRTYRLDRISKAQEAKPKVIYSIPLDFSIHDYERLPFQMGDVIGTACLRINDTPDRELVRAMAMQGSVEDEGKVWCVSFSDLNRLASWCVGCDATPLAPPELVDAWTSVKESAASRLPFDPSLSEVEHQEAPRRQQRQSGRLGSALLIRQLMTIASSLTDEGEVLTADQIAQSLGIDYDQARHLIMLMTMSGSESYTYLPVMFDDDYREVFLMQGAQLSAPRLRLTRSESIALSAALDELGIDSDDPLAKKLSSAYAQASFSEQDVRRLLELPNTPSNATLVKTLSQAISHSHVLDFAYQPVTGKATGRRHVIPQRIRRNDDSWYLDAYDLDREAERVFRIDRMSDVCEHESSKVIPTQERRDTKQMVVVRLEDPSYLELFYWEGLQMLARDERGVVVRLPYYGGSWLPRHLAACGSAVCVSSHELAEDIVRCAQS